MKKIRIVSAILTALLTAQLFLGVVSADTKTDAASVTKSGEWTPPLSISVKENPLPEGNKLWRSNFDIEQSVTRWVTGSQKLYYKEDANGGYLQTGNITLCYEGFNMNMVYATETGPHKFTGWFRTAHKGEVSQIRVIFVELDGTKHVNYVYINNDWLKVEMYMNLGTELSHIMVCGGAYHEYIQEYCMDNFSLVPVDSIPEDAPWEFGEVVTPDEAFSSMKGIEIAPWNPNEDYKVNGLMINHDLSAYFSDFANETLTEADMENFCYQWEGTHVTDYFINVDGNFPSNVRTSALDFYYMKEHMGKPVDFSNEAMPKAAHYMYEVLGSDYIGIWCETFPKIGINPWISFRMNDIHSLTSKVPTMAITEFMYKNPQYRRIKHHAYETNAGNALDYAHEEVREYYLSYINEALNRYDCYGIELDFQRELYLFYIGGEYVGLEIMNDFMRRLEDLVAVYEEKYGHEIKIAVRVAPDIQTCYDFGLDVVTWASEGIVDLVSPSGRYESHCTDMPIKIWDAVLSPFDVVLAPCIEFTNLRSYEGAAAGTQTIETLAGTAANMYSQGADKMYTYNFFMGSTHSWTEADKINMKDPVFSVFATKGFWNVITTLGSYEKCLTYNRRNILSYNDMKQPWSTTSAALPVSVSGSPELPTTLRIPVGDVLEGSELTVKFSTDDPDVGETPPTVYVNSKLCTYQGMEECKGVFTKNDLLCYKIPVEAHNEGYMVIEIMSNVKFTVDYAEVYVKSPD